MDKSDKIFLWLIGLSVIVVIAVTGYRFLFAQDYDFYVEAPCDPETRSCFARDCSEPDSCPPNNLDVYRVFYLKAEDFTQCEDNSCLAACTNGAIKCEELICGESQEDTCAVSSDSPN